MQNSTTTVNGQPLAEWEQQEQRAAAAAADAGYTAQELRALANYLEDKAKSKAPATQAKLPWELEKETATPLDYLKWLMHKADNILGAAGSEIADVFCDYPAAESRLETASALLMDMEDAIREAVERSTVGDDKHAYGDGRPCTSTVDLGHGYRHTHVWHPSPSHADNEPHIIYDHERFANSATEKSVVLNGRGVLQVVDHGVPLAHYLGVPGDDPELEHAESPF